jgi:two-component system, OmpR family, response regulator MtrA
MNGSIHRDSHRLTARVERIKQGLLDLEQDCSVWARKREEKDLVDLSYRLMEGQKYEIFIAVTGHMAFELGDDRDKRNGRSLDGKDRPARATSGKSPKRRSEMGQVNNEKMASASLNAGHRRRARILVVEDYKNLQCAFSAMLCSTGFDMIFAENGLEALAAFLDCPLDLVLIDLQISVMNGSSLAHFIKEVSPNTPVILLTDADRDTVRKQAKCGAIYSVIFKPFEITDFERTVRGALELKKAESPFVQQSDRGRFAMNTERNPVRRQGNRNIFCPLYRECLDDAIKGSWQDWDCSDCAHKLNHKNEPDPLLAVTRSSEY